MTDSPRRPHHTDTGEDRLPGDDEPTSVGRNRTESGEPPRSRFDIIEQAAIEAELETGRREETIAGAKRSLLVRIVTSTLGGFLILAGLVMLLVPGPGLLSIAIGLGLIAPDVPFAARLLDRLKDRLPQDADGDLPKSVIVGMVVSAVLFTGASVWWAFLR